MNFALPKWSAWNHVSQHNDHVIPCLKRSVLHSACRAVREGRFDDARELIAHDHELVPSDAPCLNLLGVLALANGDWHEAVSQWRRAICADAGYQPAQRNMRRYYELFAFGRSRIAIALGDEAESFVDRA